MTFIKCARSDCPNPRRDESIYCCPECSRRSNNRRQNAKHATPYLRRNALPSTCRRVTIIDPLCATPYTISMSEYRQYQREYDRLGITVEAV